jgi:hypothetical protein
VVCPCRPVIHLRNDVSVREWFTAGAARLRPIGRGAGTPTRQHARRRFWSALRYEIPLRISFWVEGFTDTGRGNPSPPRSAGSISRGPRADPQDVTSEPTLGRSAHPWRAVEASSRGESSQRLEIPRATSATTSQSPESQRDATSEQSFFQLCRSEQNAIARFATLAAHVATAIEPAHGT